MTVTERRSGGKAKVQTWRAAKPDPVNDELRAFVRAVRDGTEPVVSGEDGLRALIVANDISAEIERSLAHAGGKGP